MSSFHRNVFAYFRGLSLPDQDRERQLEDNTTKALINTLEHSDPSVTRAFLAFLGIKASNTVRFAQQKSSLGDELVRKKPVRLLLAIVGCENDQNRLICDQLPTTSDGDSRPDAWLIGDDFVVLIESKVGTSPLTLNQMACHWAKLDPPTDTQILTWADVHRFLQTQSHQVEDAKSRWIVNQAKEYLEWTGMTEFAGFREEMFEFFLTSDRDPDTQRWVRSAVDGLANRVLDGKGGLRELDAWYSNRHIGNLPSDADHYWVAFGPDKSFRKYAHQTISLYEDKLDVFVNVELLPAVEKLRSKIDGGIFRQILSELPAPFTVRIEERKKTARPRVFDYFHVADIESGIDINQKHGLKNPESAAYDYIERMLVEIEFPYLSVRRSFPRREVLDMCKSGGNELVERVLSTLRSFHPFVKCVNG